MAEVTEAPVQKREDDSWSSLSVQLLPFSNVAFRLRVVLRWIAGQFRVAVWQLSELQTLYYFVRVSSGAIKILKLPPLTHPTALCSAARHGRYSA